MGRSAYHLEIIDLDVGMTNPVVTVQAGDLAFQSDLCGTWTPVA